MKLFKKGGSCARMMTPAEYVEAHRQARRKQRVEFMINFLGDKWLNHPENKSVGWGVKQYGEKSSCRKVVETPKPTLGVSKDV